MKTIGMLKEVKHLRNKMGKAYRLYETYFDASDNEKEITVGYIANTNTNVLNEFVKRYVSSRNGSTYKFTINGELNQPNLKIEYVYAFENGKLREKNNALTKIIYIEQIDIQL